MADLFLILSTLFATFVGVLVAVGIISILNLKRNQLAEVAYWLTIFVIFSSIMTFAFVSDPFVAFISYIIFVITTILLFIFLLFSRRAL